MLSIQVVNSWEMKSISEVSFFQTDALLYASLQYILTASHTHMKIKDKVRSEGKFTNKLKLKDWYLWTQNTGHTVLFSKS